MGKKEGIPGKGRTYGGRTGEIGILKHEDLIYTVLTKFILKVLM